MFKCIALCYNCIWIHMFMPPPPRFEEGSAYSFAAVRLSVGRSVDTPTVYLYFFAEVTYIKIKFSVQINPNDN